MEFRKTIKTGSNNKKYSKVVIYKTINIGSNMVKYQDVEITKPSIQAEILQNSHELELINKKYKQKYCKFLKRWTFKTCITVKIDADVSLQKHNT